MIVKHGLLIRDKRSINDRPDSQDKNKWRRIPLFKLGSFLFNYVLTGAIAAACANFAMQLFTENQYV